MANNQELSIDRTHKLCIADNVQNKHGNDDYVLSDKLVYSAEDLCTNERRKLHNNLRQDVNFKLQVEDLPRIPIWFNVPQTVTSFTGRKEELKVIADNVEDGIVVVCGLSGIGKSELVTKFARSQYNERRGVVWIDAATRDSVVSSFCSLAKEKLEISVKGKSLRRILDEVYKRLNGDECLLIFDNAEKYNSLEEFLPFSSLNGYFILITSRNALEWKSESHKIKVLPPLNMLTKMEATQFVKKKIELSTEDNTRNDSIEILVGKLHHFPLLIKRVTEYIQRKNVMCMKRNSGFKISDYLKLLENSHAEQKVMLDELIAGIWQVTVDKIEAEDCGQDAMDMLNIIAYFEPNNIPVDVLTEHWPCGDKSCISKALTLAEKYCIVHLDNDMIATNGLVQEAIRLKNRKKEEEILKKTLILFKDHMTSSKNIKGCVPHIISLWNYAKDYYRLVEFFIVDDKCSSTYFPLISKSCSDVVVTALVDIIERQHPDKLLDVINARDKQRKTVLHYAICGGNEYNINILIEKGADVDACDDSCHRPLHLAARYGLDAVVKALLERGADINSVTSDKYKFTPLHFAAQSGYKQVIITLLKKGADINARSLYEFTSLHLASQNGHVGIVSLLLKHPNIEVEAKNGYKFTALHLAAQGRHLRVVRVLLNAGANINALDREHFTPLHLAAQQGHVDVVNEFLHNIKINIDAQTTQGNTPFHLAMKNGHFDVVQALFENNAKCDLANMNGKTALDLAVEKKHIDIIEFIQRRLTLDLRELRGENQERTFEKTATSIDGQLYEIRLVTLLLLIGFSKEVHSFNLASNMKQGHKLDDIVYKCNYYGKRKPKLLFLQAKHRNNPKEKRNTQGGSTERNKLTISHLFPDFESQKTDFSVAKYFDSYLKIRKQFSASKVKDPIFGSHYGDVDCDFVVYTNAEAAFNSDGNHVGEPMAGFERVFVERDHVLNFSIEGATLPYEYYKIIRGRNEYLDEKIDTLKAVSKCEADITEFLNKFTFFVGQPNVNELSKVIKCKIQSMYRVSNENIPTVFPAVESRVLKWWNEEKYYLTKDNRFLDDAMRINIKFDVKEAVSLFTGRVKMLTDVHETLQNEGWTVVSHAASITGLGGIGKSELVRKYISIYSDDYDGNILWINASSYLTIDESFRRLARDIMKIKTQDENHGAVNIEKIIPEVYKYFTERQRKSLFVFDNAVKYKTLERFDESIDKFLPAGPCKPHVLITSRDQEWGDIKSLPLDVFTESEAIEFILKALDFGSEVEVNEAKKLAEQLQYFPLALQQAVAYIQRENDAVLSSPKMFAIADYLAEFEKKALDLLREPLPNDLRNLYTETVFTTWTVTIDKIKEIRDGQIALHILNILGYLGPDNIPIDDIFCLLVKNTEIRHHAVELLNQYSMANLERGMLKVHRLVQQVTRTRVEKQGKEEEIVKRAYLLLTQGYPYTTNTMESYAKKQKLLSHFEEFLKRIDEFARKPEYEKVIQDGHYEYVLLVMLGQGYGNFGNPAKQRDFLERALELEERRYGPDHPDVASALCNLSNAYRSLGDPWKQLDLLERANTIYEKCYKPDDIEMAKIFALLASAYGELGEPLIQKQYIERALAIQKKRYGSKHIKVVKLLDSLASVYGTLGDPQKQKDLLEEVLSAKKLHFGTNHIEYASSLGSLSSAYGDLGQPYFQKELLEQALAIEEKFYGSDNFSIAPTLVNLGAAYSELGKYVKEKELLERVYAIEEKHYGPNNYNLATTITNLAIVNDVLGNHEKALDLLKRALPILEAHYGPDHYQVARLLVSLGNSYGNLGQHQMHKELLERALVIDENFYGPDHFEISSTLNNLGNAYADLNDHEKQKELVERALKIDIAHFGPEHAEVAMTLGNLGLAYGALGNHQKEIELLERALEMMRKFYSPDTFKVGQTLYNLANAYGHSGNHQRKRELLEVVLPIFMKHYNGENNIIENILLYLGKLPTSCLIVRTSDLKITGFNN